MTSKIIMLVALLVTAMICQSSQMRLMNSLDKSSETSNALRSDFVEDLNMELPAKKDLSTKLRTRKEVPRIGREVPRVGREVPRVGREVPRIGREVPRIGREVPRIGREVPRIGREVPRIGREVPRIGREVPRMGREVPRIGREVQRIEKESDEAFLDALLSTYTKLRREMKEDILRGIVETATTTGDEDKRMANTFNLGSRGLILNRPPKIIANKGKRSSPLSSVIEDGESTGRDSQADDGVDGLDDDGYDQKKRQTNFLHIKRNELRSLLRKINGAEPK